MIKDSTAIALIAYLQRVGKDLFAPVEQVVKPEANSSEPKPAASTEGTKE
jgi:hypothetical protein